MEGNVYKRWMEDYAGEDFIGAVNRGIGESAQSFLMTFEDYGCRVWAWFERGDADTCIENLEKRVAAERPGPERLARLTYIWHEVVRLERNFWDMGLEKLY